MKKVLIIGAGGHSKVIVDILQQNMEYEIIGLVDQSGKSGFWGIPVVGNDSDLARLRNEMHVNYAFVALGNGQLREKVTQKAMAAGYELINIISRDAIISSHARIGRGTVIMPGAVVNADVVIGESCIINTNASVDHECRIGDYSHVAPGCALSGKTKIGRQCMLGTGCRVIDEIYIGDNTIIGAGAVVKDSIVGNCTVVGVPAKVIKSST